MFKIFVTVDKHRFKFFISQTTSIRLEHSSSNNENSFVRVKWKKKKICLLVKIHLLIRLLAYKF